jgi:predicted component of type VI protein secretion system
MQFSLVVENRRKIQRVRLRSAKTIVGRKQGCGVRIPSPEVSRQHCVLRLERPGYLTIEDLNSANGTYLNGQEVVRRQVVRPGDRLQVGPVTFVAEYEMTQEVIDYIRDYLGEDVVEEVIMEAEVDAEAEEDLPLAEEVQEDTATAAVEEDDDFALPVDIVEEPAAPENPWAPPQAEELRDILSRLDE